MHTTDAKVYVVDDNEHVLDALRMLFRSVGLRVEVFSSAHEFLEKWSGDRPGVLMLDIRMPGMDGLELQEELIRRKIRIPIIFLTGHGDVLSAVKAVRRGAIDFCQKPCNDQVLIDRVYESIALDRQALDEETRHRQTGEQMSELSPGEMDVLERLLKGLAYKDIAEDLKVVYKTVEARSIRIRKKFGEESWARLISRVTAYREWERRQNELLELIEK